MSEGGSWNHYPEHGSAAAAELWLCCCLCASWFLCVYLWCWSVQESPVLWISMWHFAVVPLDVPALQVPSSFSAMCFRTILSGQEGKWKARENNIMVQWRSSPSDLRWAELRAVSLPGHTRKLWLPFVSGGGMEGQLQGWQRKLQTYPFLDWGFVLSWPCSPSLCAQSALWCCGSAVACSDTDNCEVTLILILFGRIRSNSSRAGTGTAYWERHREMQSLRE